MVISDGNIASFSPFPGPPGIVSEGDMDSARVVDSNDEYDVGYDWFPRPNVVESSGDTDYPQPPFAFEYPRFPDLGGGFGEGVPDGRRILNPSTNTQKPPLQGGSVNENFTVASEVGSNASDIVTDHNISYEHGATRNVSETNTVSDALLSPDQVIILATVIPAVVVLLVTALLLWLFVFRKKRHRNVRVGVEMQENGRINANAAPEGDEATTAPSRTSKLSISSTPDGEPGVNGDRRHAWNGNGNGAAIDVT